MRLKLFLFAALVGAVPSLGMAQQSKPPGAARPSGGEHQFNPEGPAAPLPPTRRSPHRRQQFWRPVCCSLPLILAVAANHKQARRCQAAAAGRPCDRVRPGRANAGRTS